MWWTDEKIMWYERASARCDYHIKLARIIEKHLSHDRSVLELGCGLGHVAPLLGKNRTVKAVDIDERAIECARRREKTDIYSVSDWKDWSEKADAVVCICFGHLDRKENPVPLMNLSNRHVIYTFSLHRGQRNDLVLKETTPKEEIENDLRRSGYSVTSESFTLSFPQPLKTLGEAEEFIRVSYPGKKTEDYMPFVERSGDDEFPYILRNEKKMVLFDIAKPDSVCHFGPTS